MNGSAISAASTRPWSSAAAIAGNGISTNRILAASPPFLVIHVCTLIGLRPPSAVTAMVFPLRSRAERSVERCATISRSVGLALACNAPGAMILIAIPRSRAAAIATVLAAPMSYDPPLTAPMIAEPLEITSMSTFRPAARKNPDRARKRCRNPSRPGSSRRAARARRPRPPAATACTAARSPERGGSCKPRHALRHVEA